MADRRSVSSEDYKDATVHQAVSVDAKTLAQLSSSARISQAARIWPALASLDAATRDAAQKKEAAVAAAKGDEDASKQKTYPNQEAQEKGKK